MANDRIRKLNKDSRTVLDVLVRDLFPAATYIDGIEAAPDGTIYAADYINCCVYKIFEDGRLRGTLVGKIGAAGDIDSRGMAGSTGNDARLIGPIGITVDASNNIWVNDSVNFKIKRISPSGRCIWVAGGVAGDFCSADGHLCKFNLIPGLCVDKAGIVYAADYMNFKIKKMWPNGKMTSLAGATGGGFANGNGANAKFGPMFDVTVDNHGTVYAVDAYYNRIRKCDEAGNVTTLSGHGASGHADGSGAAATFNFPIRLVMDPSNNFMYVMDYNNSAIRRVETSGRTTTFCSFNRGSGQGSHFGDITVDKTGCLYILEHS